MLYMTTPGVMVEVSSFLDSNIVLFDLGDEENKRFRGRELLSARPTISTQVVNECSHVLRRKAGWSPAQVATEMEVILRLSRVVEVQMEQVRSAWQLAERYGFSHFDSLIVASALVFGVRVKIRTAEPFLFLL